MGQVIIDSYTHAGGLSFSRDKLYTHDGACPSSTCPNLFYKVGLPCSPRLFLVKLTFLKVSSRTRFEVLIYLISNDITLCLWSGLTLSPNENTWWWWRIHESDFKGLFLEKRPWKSFSIKCSHSGMNESTPKTQSNVIWYQVKQNLKSLHRGYRACPGTRKGLQRGYMTCPMGQGEVSFDLS